MCKKKDTQMIKSISALVIVVLFIPISLLAQTDDKYLIAVDIDQDKNSYTLESIQLSVYHIFKGTLVAGASDEQINKLSQSGIMFRVLDEYPESNRYFIISGNKAEKARPTIQNRMIFDDGETFLIKDEQPDIEKFASRGLRCVEMKKHPVNYKEEKYIPQFKITTSLDSVISDVLVEIKVDSVRHFVQSLQDFGTRFLLADTKDSVAVWIQGQFEKMGYSDVILDEFWNDYTNTWQKNVVATLPGARNPQAVYIVGGHHDSYSSGNPYAYAPGADDNASGTTAVLEVARAIMESGYQPEGTIKFITFAAEEYGLYGSYDFAEKAYNSDMNIKLMINHDMISHTSRSLENSMVDINYYTGWQDFLDLAKFNTEKYTVLNAVDGSQNSAGSDSYSFWRFGFPTVYFEEHDFSPYYHSPQDIIGNYSMAFCTEVIKASCATLISASVIPSNVENLNIVDMGNGNSLLVNWASNHESDISGYHVYFGTTSGNYDSVFTTADTSILINNLMEGIEYYIGISAYDLDMYESIIVEKQGIPRTIPISPSSVYTEPIWHAVEIYWAPNSEFDVIGYNLYRSTDIAESFVKLNDSIIADTTFTDNSTENGIFYYYIVTAVDHAQNESTESDTIKSRNVSLDQGIVVVDETVDGNGSILNPTDNEVDNFYDNILERFYKYDHDVVEQGGVNLADLGAYSTIIWHGNDKSDFSAPQEQRNDVKKYLEYGGKLIYTGYMPSMAFEGNVKYPTDFSPGDFIYDFLKIQHVERSFGSRFVGATPANVEYNEIYTDSTKTPENSNYHLPSIEGISSAPGGSEIYYYDSYYDTSTAAGSMKNQPVGVAYFGDDFQVVTLSFPLYFMQEEQAKELIHYILKDQFNEVVSIGGRDDNIPNEFSLMQNYPNPFNPTTVISWRLAESGPVNLNIYNILGENVATLVSENLKAGYHQAEWDASGFASGVYFYNLQAGEKRDVKKMVLLK
jgi:hypothetical protein